MKAIEQYFHVILLIVLWKVVVASVVETLVCGHYMKAVERIVYREVNCLSFMSHAS